MALIRCPECNREISDKAPVCPHCGVVSLNMPAPTKPQVNITQTTPTKAPSTPTSQAEIPIFGIIAVILGGASAVMPYFAAVFLVPAAFIGGVIAHFKHQKMLGTAAIILAAIGLMGIFTVQTKINEIGKVFESTNQNSSISQEQPEILPIVTLAEYNAVRYGFTYEKAANIIGDPGVEVSQSEIGEYKTVMYSWDNEDGSSMNAMFQNGSLVSKSQFGLK